MIKLTINRDCIKCKRCVEACPSRILQQKEVKGEISIHNVQTCIECGHCVAICPTNSVNHSLFPKEKVHNINFTLLPSAESVMEILRKRRSNRRFTDKSVPLNLLDKILEAAALAPTARNMQALKYTLVTNPDTLNELTANTIKVVDVLLNKIQSSGGSLDSVQGSYLVSLSKAYKHGIDPILRNAKAVILIHSEAEDCTPDANLAYQNASIMAEALNVAHFYTGFIRMFSMNDPEGIIRKPLGIQGSILSGMALGMPKDVYTKYIDRKEQIVDRILE